MHDHQSDAAAMGHDIRMRQKYAVAIVLRDQARPGYFLTVKRPDDDPDLAGHWGLPAVTLQPGELIEDGARRVCREKLGCSGQSIRLIGAMYQERNTYDLLLFDVEAIMTGADKASVKQATTTRTAYSAQQWTKDATLLLPSARRGSCCSSIFLTDQGILQPTEWVRSLKGSPTVG